MNGISRQEFDQLLVSVRLTKKQRELLRYQPEQVTDWGSRDFLPVFDRTGHAGVLVYHDKAVPFTMVKRTANASGRVEAILCDICASWQRGTNSGVLTFRKSATSAVSYLVCADLDCSLHVRSLTKAGKLSKTQLREDMAIEAKIERLHQRLRSILEAIS